MAKKNKYYKYGVYATSQKTSETKIIAKVVSGADAKTIEQALNSTSRTRDNFYEARKFDFSK